jgi:cell division protein FtsZ
MTLFEVDEACNRIRDEVDPNANIIFGSTFDEKLEGSMRVSVVATGIDVASDQKSSGGTSTVRVTAISKKEEEPKKKTTSTGAVPQTEVARAMTLSARQNIPSARSTVQTAISASRTMTQPATKDEPEKDMFEQSEFQASQMSASSNSSRGYVHQGSFIPPSPVIPAPQDDVAYAPAAQAGMMRPASPQQQSYQPQIAQPQSQSMNWQPQATQAPPSTSNGGLVLRPPVPGANSTSTTERRRTPSLFERITGAYKDVTSAMGGEEEKESQTGKSSSTGSSGGFHSSTGIRAPQEGNAQATQAAPSQGQLNIDSPAAAPRANEEENLDIPAFLRRQAN